MWCFALPFPRSSSSSPDWAGSETSSRKVSDRLTIPLTADASVHAASEPACDILRRTQNVTRYSASQNSNALRNGRDRKSETPSALVGSMRQMEAGRLDDGKLDAFEPGGAQDTAGKRASLL